MPRCEGMPDGRCPDQKHDDSVKIGEGDLMLCHRCDFECHKMWLEVQKGPTTAACSSVSTSTARSSSSNLPADDDDTGESAIAIADAKKQDSIIVKELLCYAYNQIATLPNEELVNIVSQFYDDAEINSALVIIKECVNRFLPSGHRHRLPKRIGKDKKVKSVEDICTLMHDFSAASVDTAATSLPSFVAYNLS